MNSDLTTILATTGAVTGKLNSTGRKTINWTSSFDFIAGTIYYAGIRPGGNCSMACGQFDLVAALPNLHGITIPDALIGDAVVNSPVTAPVTHATSANVAPILSVL